MMTNIFSPNDMLLDQTMLCEASRLLKGAPARGSFNTERLFNLSMLLDALALHEHIYVLKAELPPDANSLQLREHLLKKGIVSQMDTAPYLSEIRREFNVFLSNLKRSRRRASSPSKSAIEQVKYAINDFLGSPSYDTQHRDDKNRREDIRDELIKEYEGNLAHWWINRRQDNPATPLSPHENDLISHPFLALGEHMLDYVDYFYSGAITTGVSHLRTFVYWRVSEHAGIPLYPSSQRIPQLDTFADHIRLSTAEKIYRVIADAFKENIELVYEDEAQIPLFLPPSLSIFLDLYRSSHDLSRTIDDFRDEFAGVRRDFRSLEEKFTNAETLQERIAIKHQLGDVIKSVKTHYQLDDDSVLESVLGYAPAVLNPLTNPADPSKYSKELLTQPVEWLRHWWRKRSLRHVFRLRERLYQVSRYERLASEVLEVQLDEQDKQKFYGYYNDYLALYGRKSLESP